jgi:hypothetical protein
MLTEAVYTFRDIRKFLFNLVDTKLHYTPALVPISGKPFLHSTVLNTDLLYRLAFISSIISKLALTLLPSFEKSLNRLRFSSHFGHCVP